MDRSKFLQSFNSPDPKLPTGRRNETNVPAQALVMLNDPLVLAMADQWSSRLVADGSPSVEDRIRSMFVQAFGRLPEAAGLARWATLIESLARPATTCWPTATRGGTRPTRCSICKEFTLLPIDELSHLETSR